MSILAANQPYFFPYIGFFSILDDADIYVYADMMQFRKQSWMCRNRVISNDGSVQYISIPIKNAGARKSIRETEIDYSRPWEHDVINRLGYYKKRAPYYHEVMDMLDEFFSEKYSNLAEANIRSIELVSERVGIMTPTYLQSELNLPVSDDMSADDWGALISLQFPGVKIYRNAPGGKEFYDPRKYEKCGLKIEFLQNRLNAYDQKSDEFIPGLSIIDVMMFNSKVQIEEMLKDFEII